MAGVRGTWDGNYAEVFPAVRQAYRGLVDLTQTPYPERSERPEHNDVLHIPNAPWLVPTSGALSDTWKMAVIWPDNPAADIPPRRLLEREGNAVFEESLEAIRIMHEWLPRDERRGADMKSGRAGVVLERDAQAAKRGQPGNVIPTRFHSGTQNVGAKKKLQGQGRGTAECQPQTAPRSTSSR
jgi:hypothetical protein